MHTKRSVINRILGLSVGILVLSTWGCAGGQNLREENELLQSEVARLQQISDDYSQEINETRRLSDSEKEKMRAEIDEMRRRLNETLGDQIGRNEALVDQLQDLTVIEIGEAALFPSGSADLSKKGTKVIRNMVDVLGKYEGFHIRVEGHTDSFPIGKSLKSKFDSNWELSSARSISVIKYMVYALKMDPVRLQAVGYAHFRPIASNNTEAGRSKNRRIRMVVFQAGGT